MRHLKVLGRANPSDKHLLAVGLKELGHRIAVTGEGINDVDALRVADVPISMGSGVSITKEVSHMIISNDNFEGTMMGLMWGRNLHENIRKFLYFQLTVNFSVVVIVLIGASIRGFPIFSIS